MFIPIIIASAESVTIDSIAVKTSPTTVYNEGAELDLSGLEVTLTYSDASTEDIGFADFGTNDLTTYPVNGTALTTANSTVTITHGTSGENVTQLITVNAITVTGVTVQTAPAKVTYNDAEELDLTGLVVTLAKSDTSTEDIAFADFGTNDLTTDPVNGTALTTANSIVTITHGTSGEDVTQLITVNAIAVAGVTVQTAPVKVTYNDAEELDLSGLVVTLAKSDTSTEDIGFADFGTNDLTTYPVNGTALTTANSTVIITHGTSGQTTTQAITVNAVSTSTSSISSSSSGGGGGSMSSGEKYENIASKDYALKAVLKDIETVFPFYKGDNRIVSVSFTSKLNGGQVKAVIEMLVDTSSQVSSSAPGNVYKNMNIYVDSNLASDIIGNSKVNFKVEKSWINDNDIDLSTITLCRYSNSKWDQLSTESKGEDDLYFYFVSTTPDFSPFAISSVEPSVAMDRDLGKDVVASSPDSGDTVMSTEDAVSMELTTEIPQESKSSLSFVSVLALAGIMFIGVLGYMNRGYYNKVRLQIGNPDGKRYRRIKQ
ncbi:PGF-pre-PGF domain-containing protein [uncultured Methanolobus sp.]|uniref:PGF-pre-PGF domain-containing protein n=1 Tax=uncultured Methanolobus sp. TaxID=218300 RepID=UPI0029C7F432|nr:PGF-pre-PGF domain-containing protein [uncultured Methanolobus sp.]